MLTPSTPLQILDVLATMPLAQNKAALWQLLQLENASSVAQAAYKAVSQAPPLLRHRHISIGHTMQKVRTET